MVSIKGNFVLAHAFSLPLNQPAVTLRVTKRTKSTRRVKEQRMNDLQDQELCLCFHVSRRKVAQFIRAERPTVASQLSQCYGAGTGCGWCRPFLEKMMREANPETVALPDCQTYAANRQQYRQQQRESLQ